MHSTVRVGPYFSVVEDEDRIPEEVVAVMVGVVRVVGEVRVVGVVGGVGEGWVYGGEGEDGVERVAGRARRIWSEVMSRGDGYMRTCTGTRGVT